MKTLANVIYWALKTVAIIVVVGAFALMMYAAFISSTLVNVDWRALVRGAALFVVIIVLALVYCWAEYRRRHDD